MNYEVVRRDIHGNTGYYNKEGQYHRLDGPAVEYANGDKAWYQNGMCHREDGPAVEWSSGSKEWWVEGKLHRTDGPALELRNGLKGWWVDGKEYTEEKWKKIYCPSVEEVAAMFKEVQHE